jgi:hypothetical protein
MMPQSLISAGLWALAELALTAIGKLAPHVFTIEATMRPIYDRVGHACDLRDPQSAEKS